ncbi:5'-nucleotidase [Salegentibacter sp. 24]|uniref:5'-nucleotidase C-terminal domain-containing protein n=1 Tax=Salegentibacter sp. 24 TaxID=2183986 RepID=UPI00105F3F88|nr:5'-nucleotidase [Salegentibacter sp. 24]TDN88708.1 5'-nucleotidase [Salegentibacter sp. 24]
MNTFRLSFYLTITLFVLSCKGNSIETAQIKAERIPIDKSINGDPEIERFIAPYKKHLNKTLDSALAYNPKSMLKSDGDLNTAIGNLMADIVMEQANPILVKRTGKEIDMVLLNHGGIRSGLNQGNITTRSAYALMPFENEIVVAELSGEKIVEMLTYLEQAKTAHPVSGVRIEMDQNYKVTRATINGKKIDKEKTYFVATSDYLQQGGDNMNFFKDPIALHQVDYKLRNAIIDYFKKVDTLKVEKDDRFIRK